MFSTLNIQEYFRKRGHIYCIITLSGCISNRAREGLMEFDTQFDKLFVKNTRKSKNLKAFSTRYS